MKVHTVLNRKGGSLIDVSCDIVGREIQRMFEAAGHTVTVSVAEGAGIPDVLRKAAASDADVVVAGGGDGTVGTAAGILLGTGKALGILPLGTLNLFARDLGVPLDLPEMVRALAEGEIRAVDVGEVNGIAFLNHSALGLYPLMVRDRERERRRTGMSKWPAMAEAAAHALRDFPLIHVTLDTGDGPRAIDTPAIIVSNNAHDLSVLPRLVRPTLDAERLALYISHHATRGDLLRAIGRMLVGGMQDDPALECQELPAFTIDSRAHRLRVANDGELFYLRPPLHYRIRPKALKVLAPRSYRP